MIWFVALASASTPALLAREVPGAREQLRACASVGCTSADAARAAWLVALDTYLDQGVADGQLAATVRVLDPELFAALPDIVQSAASDPLPWAQRVGGPIPPPLVVAPPEDTPPRSASTGRKPGAMLTVHVVDPAGNPVPNAIVRFLDEQENHRVNTTSGRWIGSVLYLRDGTERHFDKDTTFPVEVYAAGYGYHRGSITIERKRKHTHKVTLTPYDFTAPADAPPVAAKAVDGYRTWLAAEAAYVASPSDKTVAAVWTARQQTRRFARDWLDQGGGRTAHELCLMAGNVEFCGDL